MEAGKDCGFTAQRTCTNLRAWTQDLAGLATKCNQLAHHGHQASIPGHHAGWQMDEQSSWLVCTDGDADCVSPDFGTCSSLPVRTARSHFQGLTYVSRIHPVRIPGRNAAGADNRDTTAGPRPAGLLPPGGTAVSASGLGLPRCRVARHPCCASQAGMSRQPSLQSRGSWPMEVSGGPFLDLPWPCG